MVTAGVKEPRTMVEEELKRIGVSRAVNVAGAVLTAAGIMQLIHSVVTLALSSLAGAAFTLLLGGVMLGFGSLEIVGSYARNNRGRLLLGIVDFVAGLLVLGHPLYGWNFLGTLAGLFLVAAGVIRFFSGGGAGWRIGGSIVSVVLGIIVLGQASTAGPGLIATFIGVNFLIDSIMNIRAGGLLKRSAQIEQRPM